MCANAVTLVRCKYTDSVFSHAPCYIHILDLSLTPSAYIIEMYILIIIIAYMKSLSENITFLSSQSERESSWSIIFFVTHWYSCLHAILLTFFCYGHTVFLSVKGKLYDTFILYCSSCSSTTTTVLFALSYFCNVFFLGQALLFRIVLTRRV